MLAGDGDSSAGSLPGSRATSPSGEGKRLDDSSRNGSSSAFPGVEAVHQAGGGGPTGAAQRTGVDDDLPAYGPQDERAGTPTIESNDAEEDAPTLESINAEEDEGIGMGETEFFSTSVLFNDQPKWSFENALDQKPVYPRPTLWIDERGDGAKNIDMWKNMGCPNRRLSDSSTAAMASPAMSRYDDDEGNREAQFINPSDEYNPGYTGGFLELGTDYATPINEEQRSEQDDNEVAQDADGDHKMV